MVKKSTKLQALHDIFEEKGVSAETIERNDALIEKIKKYADAVPDYRHPSYIRHLLGDIIMITFLAILGNANEWEEIEAFAKKKEKWLRKCLALPYGIPADDTIRLVIGNINAEHFFELTVKLLIQTVEGIIGFSQEKVEFHEKAILSVDGKESRGSGRKDTGNGGVRALQTLNVYSADYGMCLAQEFIRDKTNEIPATQELLRLIDLKGTIVTADAMNRQRGTASAIVEGKGDYVLALKGNQSLLYEEVVEYFDEKKQEEIRKSGSGYKKTTEKEHGGIAHREYYITEDVGWYADRREWKKLRSFGMVHKMLIKKEYTGRRIPVLYMQYCSG